MSYEVKVHNFFYEKQHILQTHTHNKIYTIAQYLNRPLINHY